MHHIYHTEGIVLGSSATGEANRVFRIFTRDLGLIRASAQGVRYLKSKLRYSLHDFSCGEFSLVRGKEAWRVTGAKKEHNLYENLREDPELRLVFVRAFSLLDRLLSGEEKNARLWEYLDEAIRLATSAPVPPELVRNFEYILVLRLLASLGYLGESPDTLSFVASPFWSDELLVRVSACIPSIVGQINQSLKETQL